MAFPEIAVALYFVFHSSNVASCHREKQSTQQLGGLNYSGPESSRRCSLRKKHANWQKHKQIQVETDDFSTFLPHRVSLWYYCWHCWDKVDISNVEYVFILSTVEKCRFSNTFAQKLFVWVTFGCSVNKNDHRFTFIQRTLRKRLRPEDRSAVWSVLCFPNWIFWRCMMSLDGCFFFPPQVGRRPHTQTEARQHSHEGATAVQTSERADQQLRLGEIPGAGSQHPGTFQPQHHFNSAHKNKNRHVVRQCSHGGIYTVAAFVLRPPPPTPLVFSQSKEGILIIYDSPRSQEWIMYSWWVICTVNVWL